MKSVSFEVWVLAWLRLCTGLVRGRVARAPLGRGGVDRAGGAALRAAAAQGARSWTGGVRHAVV